REWQAVGALAVGLVLATLGIVAVVAHTVADLSWPAAFMLGAIVGPTDPVAATSLFRRLGLPERLTTILEGESLTNDGTSLVAFRVAVGATTAAGFSLASAAGQFVGAAVAGIGIGLIAGWLVTKVRRRIDDPPVEITISLFTPFLAYIPAEHVGASGVLAAVTVGLYLAWISPTGLFQPQARLQATAFWDVLVFLLNSMLFILVGLEVRPVLEAVSDRDTGTVVAAAAAVTAAVILTRLVWMLAVPSLIYALTPRRLSAPERTAMPERVVLGWAGMRGGVSLAAALSVPLDVADRPMILLITFVVILATLVGQGLTMAPLTRRLIGAEALGDHDGAEEIEAEARRAAARSALDLLEELEAERDLPSAAARVARRRYELRLHHLADESGPDDVLVDARHLQRRLAEREREVFRALHREGRLDQATARRLERELDLEEARWDEIESSPLR
ncbi:MAG TPA: sodium:proton antiporter, partial [Capillimicrobium sp.]